MSDIVVFKLGGSVLTDLAAYETAAKFLHIERTHSGRSIVAVVSAQEGHTDRLRDEAASVSGSKADEDALDLLWSTGELRSVALLTLALRREGVRAVGLNVHELGLRVEVPKFRGSEVRKFSSEGLEFSSEVPRAGSAVPRVGSEGPALSLNPIVLRAALDRHDIVVVPGFLATDRQRVVTLGRGGSDWSAVALAAALGAERCELVKDVDGYYSADPRVQQGAALIEQIDYATAIAMADEGCPLVQRQAIDHARQAGLTLIVRSFTSTGTLVAGEVPRFRRSEVPKFGSEVLEVRNPTPNETQRPDDTQR